MITFKKIEISFYLAPPLFYFDLIGVTDMF
jgi:hypothetical protein